MGTMIQNLLLCSDAFEIYVNGNLEFSKFEKKDMPLVIEIEKILHKYGLTTIPAEWANATLPEGPPGDILG